MKYLIILMSLFILGGCCCPPKECSCVDQLRAKEHYENERKEALMIQDALGTRKDFVDMLMMVRVAQNHFLVDHVVLRFEEERMYDIKEEMYKKDEEIYNETHP